MSYFKGRFEFHPVGQGLFYSGCINNFTFVYDCGTSSKIEYVNHAVDSYTKKNHAGKLDLLIISHFHADHINGVDRLLKGLGGVKEVVLPYIYPAERIFLATQYAIKNDLESLDDSFVEFMADPANYFLQDEKADRVVFLEPGHGDEPTGREESLGGIEIPRWDREPNQPPLGNEYPMNSTSIVFQSDTVCYRSSVWAFRFYCSSNKSSSRILEQELQRRGIPCDSASIAQVLGERFAELRNAYRTIFGPDARQNEISIICCHGPFMNKHFSWACSISLSASLQSSTEGGLSRKLLDVDGFFHFYTNFNVHDTEGAAPMQLLTGDANLKNDLARESFQKHFKEDLEQIGLIQIPHHGSKHNWSPSLLANIPRCQMWIASFGLGNRDKHPNIDVVNDIVGQRKHLLACHQTQGLVVEWAVHFHC